KLLRSPHAKRPPHGRLSSSRLVWSCFQGLEPTWLENALSDEVPAVHGFHLSVQNGQGEWATSIILCREDPVGPLVVGSHGTDEQFGIVSKRRPPAFVMSGALSNNSWIIASLFSVIYTAGDCARSLNSPTLL